MTPENEKELLRLNEEMGEKAPILWSIRTATESDLPFKAFLEAFHAKVSSVQMKTDDALAPPMPGIRIRKNLVWHAVPEGPELSPFLDALMGVPGSQLSLPADVAAELASLEAPADLSLFIGPGCPFCPAVVRQLLALAFHSELVYLKIIDGVMFPDAAASAQIRSVPTTVLDDLYRWTGTAPLAEIVHVIVQRDPESLGKAAFENLIADGKAARIAEMMLAKGKIFPAFIEVLAHDQWPVRLGAMVAVEYLLDENPVLARNLEPLLWERFDHVPDMTKGDLLQVLGDIGNETTLLRLKTIAGTSPSPEVREAAADGIEKISQSV